MPRRKLSFLCKYCRRPFHRLGDYRRHVRTHEQQLPGSPAKPPNQLLSRRSDGEGVFDFDGVLDTEDDFVVERGFHSDVDSFYSDIEFQHDDTGNSIDSNDNSDDHSESDSDNDSDEDPNDDSEDHYDDNDDDDSDDMSDATYTQSYSSANMDGSDDDCLSYDFEEDDLSDDEILLPNYTPRPFPDERVPISDNTYSKNTKPMRAEYIAQLQISQLFNRNKASLKMHDELVDIINAFMESLNVPPSRKLLHCKQFMVKMEKKYNTSDLKPTYGSVRLTNNSVVTVPVFNMKAMILSLLHDSNLMREENFATGLDIFTGDVDPDCESNEMYGEIHTGDAWQPTVARFRGSEGQYMPLGLVVFGDKSHTDQHGTLSVTPVTFTLTFFNREVRNNPDAWRPMAYIPNLSHGKVGGTKSNTKAQSEHYCLAYALKSLIELSENGGIRTEVMGRMVHIKPFIHLIIGDTEGLNKWLGHYNSSQPGVSRPYRDCHCPFEELSNPNPLCKYTTAIEYRRAMRMMSTPGKADLAKRYLAQQSRHNIMNAMYQARLPLSDCIHGANRMCPPELLHTLDAGLTIYILESLQDMIRGGKCREDLDVQHSLMFRTIKRQSNRDFPRGAIRSGLIETTRCQSSERKGNLFLLLCIAHTSAGELILRSELGLTQTLWKQWVMFLQMYLAMGEWFHDSRPKNEVKNARVAIGAVIKSMTEFFPRKRDSNGYNIPKVHGLTKVQYYMCLFGSAINFYGGPGEASHKLFVKMPGSKTQRRVSEFAAQTAEQYYTIMAVDKITRIVDVRLPNQKLHDENVMSKGAHLVSSSASGKYFLDMFRDGTHKVRSECKQWTACDVDNNLLQVFRRISTMQFDNTNEDDAPYTITGYTHTNVVNSDGESISYNAHPCYHGAAWYDWAYVHYEIEDEDGEGVEKYYPSKILGFMKAEDDDSISAIIQYSMEDVSWDQLEENFFVPFRLCTSANKEDIVPLSSLCHPICVIPDYGGGDQNDDKYMMVLPKGRWSQYFTRFYNKTI